MTIPMSKYDADLVQDYQEAEVEKWKEWDAIWWTHNWIRWSFAMQKTIGGPHLLIEVPWLNIRIGCVPLTLGSHRSLRQFGRFRTNTRANPLGHLVVESTNRPLGEHVLHQASNKVTDK